MLEAGFVFSTSWDVSWFDVLWPWSGLLGESIWPWDTGNWWIDIWVAVGTFSWICDWLSDTISEGLSLWSVWAVLKTGFVFSTCWDVSWDDVLWPWGFLLVEGIWPWVTGNSWISI